VTLFFVLACALSWIAWGPLALAALGWIDASPSPYLHLVGGLGPALAAFALAAREGRAPLARLVRQIVRGRPAAVIAAVAAPIAIYLGAAAILVLLGYDVDLSATGTSTEYPSLGVPSYVLANLVFYGFGEEYGWRGYALPRLRARWGTRNATLALALGWAIWHLPLFAFADGMSAMGPAEVFGWLASIVTGAFLLTYVYLRSGGSVLAVALFHGALDVLINSPTGGPLQTAMGAIVTVAGILCIGALRERAFARAPAVDHAPGMVRLLASIARRDARPRVARPDAVGRTRD
jgi:membrane protease YdiL (CAAX protease family)